MKQRLNEGPIKHKNSYEKIVIVQGKESEEKSQIKSCGEGQGTNMKVAKEEKSKDFLKFSFGYIENKSFSGIVSGY